MRIAGNQGVSIREDGYGAVEVLVGGVPILDVNEDGVCLLDLPEGFTAVRKRDKEVYLLADEYTADEELDDETPAEDRSGYWLEFSESDGVRLRYGNYYVLRLKDDGFERAGGLDIASNCGYVPFAVDGDQPLIK